MSFYETIDSITADAGIRVRGKSLEDLICKSLLATFNEITDIDKIEKKEERIIEAHSEVPFLLVDLINMAILLHESELFVASYCDVMELKKDYARVKLAGDKFDPQKNEPKLVIKAATYHNLKVEKLKDEWIAEIIFDI